MSEVWVEEEEERRGLTTHIPDTELLARNVHTLSAGDIPRDTSWFFVQLYVGNCT